jgi:hypothetical protein
MSILSIELPSELDARLEAVAGELPEDKARVVREALEKVLDERYAVSEKRKNRVLDLKPFPDGQTLGDLMKDFCGKYEGPGDLSTNPKYMEGFGESVEVDWRKHGPIGGDPLSLTDSEVKK